MAYHTAGNGHTNGGAWPKGVRRNKYDVSASVAALRKVGLYWWQIADEIGISVRTLRKYLSREFFATQNVARKIKAMANKHGQAVTCSNHEERHESSV